MFGSVVLDVTIGLVFIYLLYSLLATIVNEIIATNIGMRARFLRKGIERMLNDEYIKKYDDAIGFWNKARVFFYNGKVRLRDFLLMETKAYKKSFAAKFYDHPTIYYMAENKWHSKPSYLNASDFSAVVTSMLLKEGGDGPDKAARIKKALDKNEFIIDGEKVSIAPETLQELKDKLTDVDFDFVKFRISLEKWYDSTMERASGWYKRKVQLFLFVIGFFIAATFNVNTFNIVSVLSKDKDARNQLVEMANSIEKTDSINQIINLSKDTTTLTSDSILRQAYGTLIKDQNDVAKILGSGWGFETMRKEVRNDNGKVEKVRLNSWDKIKYIAWRSCNPINNLLGFIVTALALSLGAPFWFDMLNKLRAVKGSGTMPTPAPEVPAKAPVKENEAVQADNNTEETKKD
jgi:hypothetical protein